MTSPSIRDVFLRAVYDLVNVTEASVKRRADIETALRTLPQGVSPYARGVLEGRLDDINASIRDAQTEVIEPAAAILCLRTDDTGGCDIDLPAKRPAGRPTKSEAAARAKVATDPSPADTAQAETPATPPADVTTAAPDEMTPGEARTILRERDWADHDMDLLTPTALVGVARRNLRPEQVEINEDGGAGVAGGEVIQ